MPTWVSKIDWQGWGRLVLAILAFYGIHVTFTTPTQPVSAVVQPAAPPMSDAQFDAMLKAWGERQKVK